METVGENFGVLDGNFGLWKVNVSGEDFWSNDGEGCVWDSHHNQDGGTEKRSVCIRSENDGHIYGVYDDVLWS